MQMIMIAGKAEAGKSTLAAMIAAEAFELGFLPVMLSFAGSLKREAASKGYDKENNPEKYREYCQTYGALYRQENPDHWVEKLHEDVKEQMDNEASSIEQGDKHWERCLIIDDCRYHNEVAYGVKYDATLIFLTAGKRGLSKAEWRSHESEALAYSIEDKEDDILELFDATIFNDRTEEVLAKKVKSLVPVWCHMSVCDDAGDLCSCCSCTAIRDGKKPSIQEVIQELADLLEFDKELFTDDDEEHDDDEET